MDSEDVTLAFLDTETTGLHPVKHQIWEVGVIIRPPTGEETEISWMLPVDLSRADAYALTIGHFHERYQPDHLTSLEQFSAEFVPLIAGAHIVGVNPTFDAERIEYLLYQIGYHAPDDSPAPWSYHLVDMLAVIAGAKGVRPPWSSHQLSRLVGIDPDSYERHSALGDARWTMAMYDAVYDLR